VSHRTPISIMLDLVIRNALIVDGLGNPPRRGDLGVWVNGVQVAGDSGILEDCGRPGKLLRSFEPWTA
jgi:N-acyl-D-aspartate/D-glutamate deacylase